MGASSWLVEYCVDIWMRANSTFCVIGAAKVKVGAAQGIRQHWPHWNCNTEAWKASESEIHTNPITKWLTSTYVAIWCNYGNSHHCWPFFLHHYCCIFCTFICLYLCIFLCCFVIKNDTGTVACRCCKACVIVLGTLYGFVMSMVHFSLYVVHYSNIHHSINICWSRCIV